MSTSGWADAQQQYWAAWAGLAGNQASKASTPFWGQGLEQWWKAMAPQMAPQAPGDATQVFQRVVDMGKMYLNLAENAYGGQQHGTFGTDTVETWISALNNMGMDAFQKMGMGGFNMGGFKVPGAELWQGAFSKLLDTPAVGFNRESQERLQALAKLGEDYQSAMKAYLGAFAKQGSESITALRTRIQQLAADGKKIGSLRELYDLWVEVSEQVYGKFAMTDEYQVVYGDMVNAQMALKKGMNQELDHYYQSANLPTRTELNAAFKKQQELSRENRALRQQLNELSRKVDALATGPAAEAAPKAPPAARKSSKKTTPAA